MYIKTRVKTSWDYQKTKKSVITIKVILADYIRSINATKESDRICLYSQKNYTNVAQ